MQSIIKLQRRVEDEISKLKFDRNPINLYEPFKYMLGLSGKRIRPVMLLMASEMFGNEDAMPQAIAIELFHNFTLVHDDIMDKAPLRRGMPSVHEKFNQNTAILSGDAMLVYAYKFLLQTRSELFGQLVEVFNDCAIKVCEGQQMDMNFETANEVSVEEYLAMIEMKTSALLATSLKIGALIGGASDEDANHLYEFGKELGISFQLKDDWLDAFGDVTKTGKQEAGDIIQNKKTFLILEAFRVADNSTREEISQLYSRDFKDSASKVNAVLGIFQKLRIDQLTKTEIETHYHNAFKNLDSVNVSGEKKKLFRKLATSLLERES